jgi:hypothetical protein
MSEIEDFGEILLKEFFLKEFEINKVEILRGVMRY